jgi:tetratricopeptide (TPR) repeat protein
LIVGAFVQLATWDVHSWDVIPLQVKELIGASSNDDLEKMASICMERKRYDCVEKEYSRLSERDPKLLLRLGKFQMSRARYNDAVNTYRTFFSKGGIDLEASYMFARSLGQVGMVDEAAKYYDYVLGAKPDVLQVTVVQNYVKLLMEANRLDQAKKLIENVRSKSETSAYFMDNEFKKIQELTSGAKS